MEKSIQRAHTSVKQLTSLNIVTSTYRKVQMFMLLTFMMHLPTVGAPRMELESIK